MIIAASQLDRYVHVDLEVKVCHQDGSAWKTLRGPAILLLAERRLITGRGSHSRLKCVVLDGATPELADDIIEKAQRAAAVRGRLQQSMASRTCKREPQVAVRDGRIGTFTTYKHIRGYYFSLAERQRQARSDAERRQSGARR